MNSRRFAIGLLLLVSGCPGAVPSDAAGDAGADAGTADAGPSGPTGEHHHYVMRSMSLPTTAQEAAAFGADLDGDSTIDNQMGAILAALASGAGVDFNAASDDAFARGDVLLLADLQATDLAAASNAGFTIYRGANPTPAPCTDPLDPLTCGRHLDGAGSFEIAAGSPTDATLAGALAAGAFDTTEPGELLLSVPFGGTAAEFRLRRARVEVATVSAAALGGGTIAGAVPDAEVQGSFVPALHAMLGDIVQRDCTGMSPPDCGCVANSSGRDLITQFDDDDDCSVTLAEFQGNALTAALLAPDVDTDQDGTPDALSLGVGFDAVAGAFAQP